MKIYSIIVNYNGLQWIENCLKSTQNSSVPMQTIVIDNKSTDGTVEFIETHFPDVILLKQKTNLGFGKANNLGIEYALKHNADFFFLINQDAWIFPDTVSHLLNAYTQNPEYFILSPLFYKKDNKTFETHFKKYTSEEYCPNFNTDFNSSSTLKTVYPLNFIHAALWFLPRKCIDEVGGFDPVFPHRGEDNDFVNRVLFRKGKIGICPAARAVHDNEVQEINSNSLPFRILVNRYLVIPMHILKNINNRTSIALLNSLMYYGKGILYHLRQLEFKGILTLLIGFCKFITKFPQLFRSRRVSIQKKANYLN